MESCQRGPGRNENDPARRRTLPPSSLFVVVVEPLHFVCADDEFPSDVVKVHAAGRCISGPPRVSARSKKGKLLVTPAVAVQKFLNPTLKDGRIERPIRSLSKSHSLEVLAPSE